MSQRLFVLAACGSLLLSSFVAAQPVPRTLGYGGMLENASGEPVNCTDETNCPDGLLSMTFRLYADDVETAPLWSETHAQVPVRDGLFRVELGSQSALSTDIVKQARTLGVSIADGDELLPRQRLVAVAFSLVAATAEDAAALGGTPAEDFATIDDVLELCVTPESLATTLADGGYVTQVRLPEILDDLGVMQGHDGSNDTDTLGGLSCATGEIPKRQGPLWVCAIDIDTTLNDDQVVSIVTNAGFVSQSAMAPVATLGTFSALDEIPAGLSDGDDDTLGAMSCVTGEIPRREAGTWVCAETPDNPFVLGGNAFDAIATIGTNDDFALSLQTNGQARMTILEDGRVGIGTTTPAQSLAVEGSIRATGTISSGVAEQTASLASLTLDFAQANTIRASGAAGPCGILNITNTTAGGQYTVTIQNASSTCSTIHWNGASTGVKLPVGYFGGAAVSGAVYTFLDDGRTLWVSYVGF
jgi:hypothetical protein